MRCTSAGYALSVIADYFFLSTLVAPFAVAGFIAYSLYKGIYAHSTLLLFILPIIFYLASWILDALARWMAQNKGFQYDYEKDECTWNRPEESG